MSAQSERDQSKIEPLNIRLTAGDAEMVVSWAAAALRGERADPENSYLREACARFREAFNDAAQERLMKQPRTLLAELAKEGASRCCYMPGAGNPEAWPESRCDCKYLGPAGQSFSTTSEQTGCCEIRAAYRVVKARMG